MPSSSACRPIRPRWPPTLSVRAEIQRVLDEVNARFARIEQVKRFAILDRELTQDDGELTPTLKIKRAMVYDEFAEVFAGLYDG